MLDWFGIGVLAGTGIVSIYLIAKGVEILQRGFDPSSPTRKFDLLCGLCLLIPGAALGIFFYFWVYPWVLSR